MEKKIKICFIESFPSLMEGILVLTGISKNQIKKRLTKKELNRKIQAKEEIDLPINLLNHGRINPVYMGPVIKTLFEDENFLIISKPPKVHCHPISYDETDNILSYLLTIAPELLDVNKEEYDRGLFYRLDYETSGILYFSKKTDAQNMLRDNFSQLVTEKKYLAVVSGKAENQKQLKHRLLSYGDNNSKVKVDDTGKLCESAYELIEYNETENLSLISVSLKQGHRHQIRVQLQAEGLPILGDPLYGNTKHTRMMLHCYQYVFDFNNTHYEFKNEWSDLRSLFSHFNS